MISFTVRMQFPEDSRQEIDDCLRQLTAASREEPGCVSYIAHRIEGEPDTVFLYEQYTDAAAVDAHRGTSHFQRWAVGVLYQRMLNRSIENLVALG